MSTALRRWREILVFIVSVASICAVFAGWLTWRNQISLSDESQARLKSSIEAVAPIVFTHVEHFDFASVVDICQSLILNSEIEFIRVRVEPASGERSRWICGPGETQSLDSVVVHRFTRGPDDFRVPIKAFIEVGARGVSRREVLLDGVQTAVIAFLAMLALLLAFSYVFARLFIFPSLNNMLAAMRATTTTGEIGSQVLSEHGIMGEFAAEFAKMRDVLRRERILKSKVERTLKDSETRQRITLNAIADAVIATDSAERIILMNAVAECLLGARADEAAGQRVSEVVQLEAIDPDAGVLPFEGVKLLRREGVGGNRLVEDVLLSESVTPLIDGNENVVGKVIVLHDLSRVASLQKQLLNSEKMQAIGQLASGIAHDFNNILGTISALAQLLIRTLNQASDSASKERLMLIDRSVERAAGLVATLTAFGRAQEIKLRRTSAHAVLDDTVAILRQTVDRSIEIEVAPIPQNEWFIGDKSAIQSVVINLCLNSCQAMRNGGKLTIAAYATTLRPDMDKGFSLAAPPGDYLAVSVHDEGGGIPADVAEQLFDPFFTTRSEEGGTGLGLATVFRTMESHKGAIRVESELGKGATFTIYVPLSDSDAEASSDADESDSGWVQASVLVVDDEVLLLESIAAMLVEIGCQVVAVPSGIEAERLVKRDPRRFDLVIMDLNMPKQSGAETASNIWSFAPDCRISLLTGHAEHEALSKCDHTQLFSIIQKPFRYEDLRELVRRAMSKIAD